MNKSKRTTFVLSPEAREILEALAKTNGLTMTGVLEVIIREKAQKLGLSIPEGETSKND